MESERSSQYWNSVSSDFIASATHDLWRSHADRVNIALLTDWLGERQFGRILKTDLFDEAVCDGLYPFLSDHARDVHGIDIGMNIVEAATSKYPDLKAMHADVKRLPYPEEHFDLIVSNSTLDHFESGKEIEQSLKEIQRVLRSGGELIVSFDNLQNPLIRLRNSLPFKFLNRLNILPYFVGITVGRRGLIAALESAGFEVLETRAVMHCPRVAAVFLAGLIQRRGSLKWQRRFLAAVMKFERLSGWYSCYYTGHFVAARAVRI
jgi:SAM-dependent methyltransferase